MPNPLQGNNLRLTATQANGEFISIIDAEGKYKFVADTVHAILGYAPAEMTGLSSLSFIHSEDQALTATLGGESLINQVTVLPKVRFKTKAGEWKWLERTVTNMLSNPSVQGFIINSREVINQQEQLNNIMELLPESFYTLDANWCYTYVNDFYATHTVFDKQELLGKNIWELFPDQLNTKFYRECMQVALTGLPSFFELYSDDLSNDALSYHIFPTGKGVSVHFVDVSEKKREHDRLEKLSLVASKTTTCVMIINAEKRIEWVNKAFENVTGYTLEDVLMKYPSQVLVGVNTSAKTRAKINRKMEGGKPFRGEILNYTKYGKQVWFDLEITPVFNKDGKLSKYISIRTDITDKKLKEKELMEVARDLFKQNRDLQQFSYIVSHNLRAPASNLMGLANILSSIGKNDKAFDEILDKIKASAQALDGVVRDMNHILSVRENSYAMGKEEINISDVCKEVLAGIQYKLRGFEYEIKTDLDNNITLVSNRVYLFEVLKNLFLNAVKFRKEHDVFKLYVSVHRANDKILLSVKDNGIGMDMDVIKNDIFKIYKKFHRGYEGQGLGLFLVKTYLDALGGSIKVKSMVNTGTTFQINFNAYA
jgi:PAS domain S-box-containing protein